MERSNDLREIKNKLISYYEIPFTYISKISHKSFQIRDTTNNNYFLKVSPYNALEKYQFLFNQGIDNVLYPINNTNGEYISRDKEDSFYLTMFYPDLSVIDEVKAENMVVELKRLHENTVIKRQLSERLSRPKFEEITNQLDSKFKIIENYIRSIESRNFDEFSMPILGNYQYILNAKHELIRLQKRIISSIKAKDKVDYVFIHNRPSLDHLINVKGINYLTSIENGKIGINSLDLAKFYIHNEHLNLDFHEIIVNGYFNGENSFYYDYFRFLVLFIYIKKLEISSISYVSATSFVNISKSIDNFFKSFLDIKEDNINTDYEYE